MKRKSHSFELLIFESADELSPEESSLLQRAAEARKNAYAPYSNFKVGAAALLENGEVVIGNNQENASFPSGLCAERVAVFHAGARFPDEPILKIAIVSGPADEKESEPAAPCGNCRQSIFEYEYRQERPIELLLKGTARKVYKCQSIRSILPLAFGSDSLK